MKKLTQGATRLLVLALGLGLAATGWGANFVAGWDMSAIWERSLVASEMTIASTPITCETPSGAIDFTMAARMTVPAGLTGAATLISWDMTHSNGGLEIFLVKDATSDGVARIKLGWAWKGSGNITTYSGSGQYYDWTVDNNPHDWTIAYEDSSAGTKVYLDGVKIAEVSGLRFGGLLPTIRIGGATGSIVTPTYPVATGLVVHAASYRQGNTFPTSLTSNGYTLNFNGNTPIVGGVAIGSATDGLSVTFANGDDFYNSRTLSTVVEIENAPTAASDAMLINFTYPSSQIGLRTNGGTLYQMWKGTTSGYGTASWTPASHQTITFTSDRSSDATRGTRTIIDSTEKISNWAGLCTSENFRSVQFGYFSSSSQVATGLKIYSIKLYTTKLDTTGAASALKDIVLYDGASKTATGDAEALFCGESFSNGFTLDLAGHDVSLAETYTGSGAVTVNDSVSGGTLDIGISRPTIGGLAAGATLAITPVATLNQQIEGYTATVDLSITGNLDGTVKLNGDTVTPVVEGGTATLTTVVPSNPSYTGDAWWWDYEFNGTVTSIGSDKGGMTTESDASVYYNNSELYFQQTPWRNASFNDKSELTAIMYCAPGNYANTVLVGFGSTTANDQKAIALVTGANPSAGEMKLVLTDGHSGGTGTVTPLADLTAVGATTTKHLYAFVMDRITEDDTTKTRVRVYLDGKVKAIYKHNGTLTLSNGFQIGSLHGGVAPRNTFDTGFSKYSSTGDSGTLDFLRVINGTLTDGAMAALAEEYPYDSQFGAATRAPVSASASFVATDVWTQTVPGQAAATQNAPNPNTNVTLSKDGSSDVSVAINLTENSAYESLTLTKEAGASGSLKLTSGYGNSTAGKLVSAETSVLVDTTVPGGRVNLGVTSIADGITLTVDPFSPTGNYSIYDTLATLDFGGVYEDVVVSMALLGDGASVVLDPSGVATLAESGFTAELVYNPDNLSYTFKVTREAATADISVAIDSNGVASWSTRNVPVPAQTSLPDTYAGTVTINSSSAEAVEIATDFGGGSIAVSSGTVELSGDSSVVNVSGSGTVQVTGSLAVSGTFANTLTLAGDGTVTFATLPASALTFGTWTGTVVLPQLASIAGDTFSFNSYGVEGSTVRVSGIGGGWLKNEEVNPTIDIPEDVTLRISDFSASFNNTFKALSGAGTFAVTYNTAIDTTSGSWYSNYSAYFLVKNVSNFTGSLSTATPGIAIGSAKPAYNTPGGKIYLTSVDATLAASATPVPETTVEGYYVKQVEGVYSLESFKVITFKNYDETVLQTISDARLGDTPAYTEATPTKPADAQYTYTFDAWDPAIAEVTGNATYTATYTSTLNQYTLTIPVVEHATAVVKVGGAATDDRTFDYGTAITIEWAAASGYKITAGATQTINSIAANTTADTPTVEAMGATVSDVSVSYGADYASATVTATISDTTLDYYISWSSGEPVKGSVSGSQVTFDVSGINHTTEYQSAGYTITAKDGETVVQTTGGSGTSVAADTTSWFSHNSSGLSGGTWSNAVDLSEGPATVENNTFSATTGSTSSRVVLEFNVCFSSASDADVEGEAQAAIKLGEVNSATTFMVLAQNAAWTPVSRGDFVPDASATYKVVMTIDYGNGSYGVTVGDNVLTNASGSASFPLAKSGAASVKNIDFAGSGTLTSMKGDQVEGYMVVDKNGTRYPTIAAAIAAYNADPTIGPLKVLHAGTAPSGWSIVSQGGIDILKKLAKGFFFMAY